MGNELGYETYIDRPLMSSALLFTRIVTLIGDDYFWSCHTNLVSKCQQKNKKWLSTWYILHLYLHDI